LFLQRLRRQQRNLARWSGHTRDWSYIGVVTLNPERDMAVSLPVSASHPQRKAA
jgi:putative transposase